MKMRCYVFSESPKEVQQILSKAKKSLRGVRGFSSNKPATRQTIFLRFAKKWRRDALLATVGASLKCLGRSKNFFE